MWWQFITMPVGGGVIGWFTNHLAVRMLFRPREARRVLGVTFQGLIPRRRSELAAHVADAVESEFLSHEDIEAILRDPGYQEAFGKLIELAIHEALLEKFSACPRVLRAVIGEGLVDRVAAGATQEVTQRLPHLIEGAISELEKRLDIRELITAKINAFDLDRLEAIVLRIASTELRFIEVLGGVVGAVVGVAMAALQCLLGG